MPLPPLEGIETWIFDLDNTLYPPELRLQEQIDARMAGFIMAETGLDRAAADALRHDYWQAYGTTLRGLMLHHGVDPACFLAAAHAIDYSVLRPDPVLARVIAALPGRKIVHTNGARSHAATVIAARGLDGVFEVVFAIEDKDLAPKPSDKAYRTILQRAGIEPASAAMIEDDARNLEVPKALGMATVWLCHQDDRPAPAHVDHRITDLTGFLSAHTGPPD